MTARLFVALPLPEAVSDVLLDTMEGVDAARWQEADNLHITLRYIGEVDGRLADDLHLALSAVRAAPFALQVAGVGHFEEKQRGKALWAALARSAPLEALRGAVEMACRRAGLAAETRRFLPHVTLARMNRSTGDFTGWLSRHAQLCAGPWEVRSMALYQSHLRPGGAHYEVLETYRLAP